MVDILDIYTTAQETFAFLGPDGFSIFLCFVLILGAVYLLH